MAALLESLERSKLVKGSIDSPLLRLETERREGEVARGEKEKEPEPEADWDENFRPLLHSDYRAWREVDNSRATRRPDDDLLDGWQNEKICVCCTGLQKADFVCDDCNQLICRSCLIRLSHDITHRICPIANADLGYDRFGGAADRGRGRGKQARAFVFRNDQYHLSRKGRPGATGRTAREVFGELILPDFVLKHTFRGDGDVAALVGNFGAGDEHDDDDLRIGRKREADSKSGLSGSKGGFKSASGTSGILTEVKSGSGREGGNLLAVDAYCADCGFAGVNSEEHRKATASAKHRLTTAAETANMIRRVIKPFLIQGPGLRSRALGAQTQMHDILASMRGPGNGKGGTSAGVIDTQLASVCEAVLNLGKAVHDSTAKALDTLQYVSLIDNNAILLIEESIKFEAERLQRDDQKISFILALGARCPAAGVDAFVELTRSLEKRREHQPTIKFKTADGLLAKARCHSIDEMVESVAKLEGAIALYEDWGSSFISEILRIVNAFCDRARIDFQDGVTFFGGGESGGGKGGSVNQDDFFVAKNIDELRSAQNLQRVSGIPVDLQAYLEPKDVALPYFKDLGSPVASGFLFRVDTFHPNWQLVQVQLFQPCWLSISALQIREKSTTLAGLNLSKRGDSLFDDSGAADYDDVNAGGDVGGASDAVQRQIGKDFWQGKIEPLPTRRLPTKLAAAMTEVLPPENLINLRETQIRPLNDKGVSPIAQVLRGQKEAGFEILKVRKGVPGGYWILGADTSEAVEWWLHQIARLLQSSDLASMDANQGGTGAAFAGLPAATFPTSPFVPSTNPAMHPEELGVFIPPRNARWGAVFSAASGQDRPNR